MGLSITVKNPLSMMECNRPITFFSVLIILFCSVLFCSVIFYLDSLFNFHFIPIDYDFRIHCVQYSTSHRVIMQCFNTHLASQRGR